VYARLYWKQESAMHDYTDLIETLAEQEPHAGFNSVRDIPNLTWGEIAAVLRVNPEIMASVDLKAAHIADQLDRIALDQKGAVLEIGCTLTDEIRAHARLQVLTDVQIECERRDQEHAEAAKEYRYTHHMGAV
jgi:hypothetical protein